MTSTPRGTTTRLDLAQSLLVNLDQRLGAAANVLLGAGTALAPGEAPLGETAARALPQLIELCADHLRHDVRWLVLTALRGSYPTTTELVAFGRYIARAPARLAESAVLEDLIRSRGRGRLDLPMDVVSDGVVVDVDFTARNDTHTGIHRVVRETLPRWRTHQTFTAGAWIDEYSALRSLDPVERARVFEYGAAPGGDAGPGAEPRLVVPWHSVVILLDVPNAAASDYLAAMGALSGNELVLVGYDMIPVTSAETRPFGDSLAFAQHLSVVKHARRVAAISRSATQEFRGFGSALAAQGLAGPTVTEVLLTEDAPPAGQPVVLEGEPGAGPRRPRVVCIGSREPHKNQRAVVHAAQRLWAEGLDFELELIGGPGWNADVLAPAIARVKALGLPLIDSGRVDDNELWTALRTADFSVFISLHEGYGLPLADSLACGTPAITSNFGSQQEIAELGGCLTVDPRDDDQVTDAMRLLLTDPDTLARLRTEAAARPRRSWDDYADELWQTLVPAKGTA